MGGHCGRGVSQLGVRETAAPFRPAPGPSRLQAQRAILCASCSKTNKALPATYNKVTPCPCDTHRFSCVAGLPAFTAPVAVVHAGAVQNALHVCLIANDSPLAALRAQGLLRGLDRQRTSTRAWVKGRSWRALGAANEESQNHQLTCAAAGAAASVMPYDSRSSLSMSWLRYSCKNSTAIGVFMASERWNTSTWARKKAHQRQEEGGTVRDDGPDEQEKKLDAQPTQACDASRVPGSSASTHPQPSTLTVTVAPADQPTNRLRRTHRLAASNAVCHQGCNYPLHPRPQPRQ